MAHRSEAELTYEAELTGLLIVDPYNDFLSEGGKLYELSRSTLETNNVVEHIRQILAAARAAGVQVFIAPHHRWRKSDPYDHWKTMPSIQASAAKGHAFADGTWGGSFHPDFEPRSDEVVAQEHWLSSGFANTDLDLQLKKHGLQQALAAHGKPGDFYDGKRLAAQYFFHYELPKTTPQFDLLDSGDRISTDLDENWF
jgi:ureidoacrylate peracid hydrolase